MEEMLDTGCTVLIEHGALRREAPGQRRDGLCGGEGLFLVHMTGPYNVTLQTLPVSRTARRVVEASCVGRGEMGGAGGAPLGSILVE